MLLLEGFQGTYISYKYMLTEELQILLEAAAVGNRKAAEKFYHYLWTLEVYIPVKMTSRREHAPGEDFVMVEHEGNQIIPIFSSEENFKQWSEGVCNFVKKEFKSFLWLVPKETWLHFDSGLEYGKEMSPWELEQLKDGGVNAFEDILNEVLGVDESQVAIYPLEDDEKWLRQELIYILESYPAIQEAFLIKIKLERGEDVGTDSKNSNQKPQIVLGIRHDSLSEEKLQQLNEDIEQFSTAKFDNKSALMLIQDLHLPSSIYRSWFADTVPFYIAQK